MPYKYEIIETGKGGFGLRPMSRHGDQDGPVVPWGGKTNIWGEPVPEESGPAPTRHRGNPMASPDVEGQVWAMGRSGPYVAYRVGGNFNQIARWNAKIADMGDYFIDPPNLRSMKKKAKRR